ncbi:hypothetical protein FE782_09045 [Paenibacillus antri]|uniref:Uncharacterized protein n=1 Tax=Paenibacillus antri TaxID=2582848 RepID=A0A5R9GAL4_9BACL|nr:hypothetical protein [Paenibacillus antri]TLS52761.1 hypothetical protein FE782_09045 [Paenibacillus antri]
MKNKPKMIKTILYQNPKHGFAILFPRWWKQYAVVDRQTYGNGNHQETFLSFHFRYKGKIYDPIVTIVISPLTGKAWRRYYGGSPVSFLAQHKGVTYGFLLAGELPSEFLRPDKMEYDYAKYGRPIRILKKLVSEVPAVVKSLHFIQRSKIL